MRLPKSTRTAFVAVLTAVPLCLTAASVSAAPDLGIDDMIIEAHRGGPKLGAPENTVKLFRLATRSSSVDRIETDVRLTEDNVPVTHHNATLAKSCSPYAKKAIRDLTWSQLKRVRCSGQPVPSLAQALDVVRGKSTNINVELKLDKTMNAHEQRVLARNSVRTILAAKLRDGQASISSFFWREYAATVEKYAKGSLSMTAMELSSRTDADEDVFTTVRDAKALGVDRMWFSIKDAHGSLLAFIKDYGGMEVELLDRSNSTDTRYAIAHGLRLFPSNDPVRARRSVKTLVAELKDRPLKQKLSAKTYRRDVLKRTLLRSNQKAFPKVLGSKLLPLSAVKRLEDITFSVTIKGHGKGEVELAPSGSRPGVDGVRIPIPDGTQTFTVSTGPGDGGRIRVLSTATSKVTVTMTGYRVASY